MDEFMPATDLHSNPNLKEDISYCFIIFKDIGRFYGFDETQTKVLLRMALYMDWDNVVRAPGYDKNKWFNDIERYHRVFNAALSKLMDVGHSLRERHTRDGLVNYLDKLPV